MAASGVSSRGAPIPFEGIVVQSNGCFEHGGRVYYLKAPPSKRASGGVGEAACLTEVLASKLIRYLLGNSHSPECLLVVDSDGKPLSVASRFIEATEEFGEDIFGSRLKPLLKQFAEVFAASYLLGETDLNTQSIRVAAGVVHKIDHDRALGFEPFPLVPGSSISVFALPAPCDDILSWCGFSIRSGGDVPSFKQQLQLCSEEELLVINAAARAIFERMQDLSDAEIVGMVGSVGFTEEEATSWTGLLKARRDECRAFMAEPSSSVAGVTRGELFPEKNMGLHLGSLAAAAASSGLGSLSSAAASAASTTPIMTVTADRGTPVTPVSQEGCSP